MKDSTLRDKITNLLLLLYAIRQTELEGRMDDDVKLQKMIFLSELKLVKRRWKAFDYKFFRWHKGPFSKALAEDLTRLRDIGLVNPNMPIESSEIGEDLLGNCEELFLSNKRFMKLIDNTIKTWATRNSDSMMKSVYKQQIIVPRKGPMFIQDVDEGTLLLFAVSDKNAEETFEIDESWLVTLEASFDRNTTKALDDAYNDALEGNASEFQVRTNRT